jgi:hypothetical protein
MRQLQEVKMSCGGTQHRVRLQNMIHADVVGLGEGGFDFLKFETNAEFDGGGASLGEGAVVKSATTTEASTEGIEGDSGADKDIYVWDRYEGCRRIGFGNFERARSQNPAVMEGEIRAGDPGVEPGEIWASEDDG